MAAAVFIALAGLMGAGGVVLLAASAHAMPGAGLDRAGQMLLVHAAAMLGTMSAAHHGLAFRPLAVIAMAGFVLGSALFAGDLGMRAFAGHRLFPMAAPTGGVVLIGSWLVLAVAGIIGLARS